MKGWFGKLLVFYGYLIEVSRHTRTENPEASWWACWLPVPTPL